ncbi:ML4 [Symbiodinium natans]|uniref:ML4 protein n=1 Tax=Symbiodinium natans TaxID=878477 RepID=A0A812RSK8_9DINO|nr:ML4 [Symbiodinium natans]
MNRQVHSSMRRRHAAQLFKTDMCKFFLEGRCQNGDACSYAHEATEVRTKPDLTRTSMCRTLLRDGACNNDNCRFAHSESELRSTHGFFKMKMCVFAQSGKCKHGSQCRFAHSVDELHPVQPAVEDVLSASFPIEEESPQKEFRSMPSRPSQTYSSSQQESQGTSASTTANGGSTSGQSSNENSGSAPTPRAAEVDPQSSEARSRASLPCSAWNERNERNENSDGSSWASGNSSVTVVPRSEHTGTGSPPATTSDSSSSGAGNGQAASSTTGARTGASPEAKASARRPTRSSASTDNHSTSPQQVTTLLISNVPTYLTQGALLSMFEDLTTTMRGNFDFFYCPWDHKAGHNFGYALINFTDAGHASEFQQGWTGKELCRSGRGPKPLKVVKASLQGLQANVAYFQRIEIGGRCPDIRFRPLYRDDEGSLKHLARQPDSVAAETEAVTAEAEALVLEISQEGDAGTGASVNGAGGSSLSTLVSGSTFLPPQDDRASADGTHNEEPRRRGKYRKRRPEAAAPSETQVQAEAHRLRPLQQPLPRKPVSGVEAQELRQLSLQQQQQQVLKIMEHHEEKWLPMPCWQSSEMKRKQMQQREERRPPVQVQSFLSKDPGGVLRDLEATMSPQLQVIQAQQIQLLAAQQQLLQQMRQSSPAWPTSSSTLPFQDCGPSEDLPPFSVPSGAGQYLVSRVPSEMHESVNMALYMASQTMSTNPQLSSAAGQVPLAMERQRSVGTQGAGTQQSMQMVPYMMFPVQAFPMTSDAQQRSAGAGLSGPTCGGLSLLSTDEVYTD